MDFENAYALLIGTGSEKKIEATANDAVSIGKILEEHARYPYNQVMTLNKQLADKEGIVRGFNWLIEKADNESTVLIYYAGHGSPPKDGFCDEYHLRPYDYGKNPPDSVLRASEFKELFEKIIAGKLILFINSCHADGTTGGVLSLDNEEPAKSIVQQQREFINTLDRGKAKVIISAARAYEKSYLESDSEYTLFGKNLINALRGAGSPGNEIVTLPAVYNYLDQYVHVNAKELGKDQNVTITGKIDGNFAISKNVWQDEGEDELTGGSSDDQSPIAKGTEFDLFFDKYDEGEEELTVLGNEFCHLLRKYINQTEGREKRDMIDLVSSVKTQVRQIKGLENDLRRFPNRNNNEKLESVRRYLNRNVEDFRYGKLIQKLTSN